MVWSIQRTEFSKLFKDWVFGDINHFSLIFSLSLTVLPQGYQATFAHGLQLTEKELVWGNFGDPSVKSYPWQHRPTLSTLKQKKIFRSTFLFWLFISFPTMCSCLLLFVIADIFGGFVLLSLTGNSLVMSCL